MPPIKRIMVACGSVARAGTSGARGHDVLISVPSSSNSSILHQIMHVHPFPSVEAFEIIYDLRNMACVSAPFRILLSQIEMISLGLAF